MEGAIAVVIQSVFHQKAEEKHEHELLSEIDKIKRSLDAVSARFEFQSDPDLVEACIYEMQALTAKYRFLLKEARRLGITSDSSKCLHTG